MKKPCFCKAGKILRATAIAVDVPMGGFQPRRAGSQAARCAEGEGKKNFPALPGKSDEPNESLKGELGSLRCSHSNRFVKGKS